MELLETIIHIIFHTQMLTGDYLVNNLFKKS